MAIKKNTGKKKNGKDEEKITELDKFFRELLNRKEEDVEEEDLESMTNFELKNLDFTDIHIPETESSPALERMTLSAPRPIFVGGIPQGISESEEGNGSNDPFKYMPGTGNSDDPKYISSQEGVRETGERINMETLGRQQDLLPHANQEAISEKFSDARGFSSQGFEKTERVERFAAENSGRRNFFEDSEEKYKKYNPKLPKG